MPITHTNKKVATTKATITTTANIKTNTMTSNTTIIKAVPAGSTMANVDVVILKRSPRRLATLQ